MPHKALSAIVAVVLLLMMTVGAAGMAYVFISGLQQSGQESTQGQLSTIQEAISSCMAIDTVYSNKVYLRNCGDGIIDNASLKVYMDDEPISLSMSPSKISKGDVGTVSLYGIYDLAPYTTHKLKIQNEAASVSKRVSAEPRKDDLVGGWDFDDGSGTSARDWSGMGNGGTLQDGAAVCTGGTCPTWVAGKVGGGLKFDGSNDMVTTNKDFTPSTTSDLTWSVWARPAILTTTDWHYIINHAGCNGGIMQMTGGGIWVEFRDGSCGFYATPLINNPVVGAWYQIVVSWSNSTKLKGYVNGALVLSDQSRNDHRDWGTAQIGDWYPNAGTAFNGVIDDVRIYNKALSPDELVNLKAA